MITNEQVEAALKAWYDAGDAGNFASMFAALKAAELTSCARIAELEAALKPFAESQAAIQAGWNGADSDYRLVQEFKCGDLRAAAAALKETGDE